MNKDKLKVSFEIDRYKVIGMLSRNCENAEEYNEIMDILEGKNEFVRDANGNEELASRICNYALDSILARIQTWLFVSVWIRNRKARMLLMEIPMSSKSRVMTQRSL